MKNDITKYDYLNNISDILSYLKENKFIKLLNNIDNTTINIKNRLLHNNSINHQELFYFNLDNYISFIKNKLLINELEIRYIISLTLYNKYNKILYSKVYYYDNPDYYHKEYIKMFMYNYNKNYTFLKKHICLKKLNFDELIKKINQNKKSYVYLELINSKNIDFYLPIIESIN